MRLMKKIKHIDKNGFDESPREGWQRTPEGECIRGRRAGANSPTRAHEAVCEHSEADSLVSEGHALKCNFLFGRAPRRG
jgi:hypothetical protein